MHDFRRRPEDLTAEQTQALEDLFAKVPALGVIYHLRWRATEIFATAGSPAAAAKALNAWITETRESALDWEPFITMLHGHWRGILAYFQDRCTSGPVEGINNKLRVIMRPGYGSRSVTTLWTRAILDINGAWKKVGPTSESLRTLVARIQAHFAPCYT
jgi:transposase